MKADFLLLRAEDHLVLGVRWTGMTVVAGAPPSLRADTDESRLVVTLPPQHVGEQVEAVDSFPQVVDGVPVFGSRLAGPSWLSVRPGAGSTVPLTADGILAALAADPLVSGSLDPDGTVLEVPWRLRLSPDAGTTTGAHPSEPVVSPTGVVGLWRTILTNREAPGQPVPVRPVDPQLAEIADPFPVPLSASQRLFVVQHATASPAPADRLELSSLGASLGVHLVRDTFEWRHHAALGRDLNIRTIALLRAFPFNHRMQLSEITERVLDPAGENIAVLRKRRVLTVLEPVVDLPTTGVPGREFPFHRVEVLDLVHADLPEQRWTFFTRDFPAVIELRGQIDTKAGERGQFQPAVDAAAATPRSFEELLAAGFGPALQMQGFFNQSAPFETQLAELEPLLPPPGLESQLADLNRQLSDLLNMPFGPDGFPDPGVQSQIDATNAAISEINALLAGAPNPATIQSLRNQIESLRQQAAQFQPAVDAEIARPRSVQELANGGMFEAGEVLRLDAEIAELQRQVQELLDLQGVQTPWYFVPSRNPDVPGDNILFTLRFSGDSGDVTVTMPLVAVNDAHLDEAGGAPPFSALSDQRTVESVTARWHQEAAEQVAAPGSRVTMVRSAEPKPGDVLEVHGLTIDGVLDGTGFRPLLTAATVRLPEVRTLLGDDPLLPISFTPDYLTNGEAEDLAFQLLDENPLDLSFLKQADKSGGLVAPRMLADSLSRELGPVAAAGVASFDGQTFDAKALLAQGATILGFDLSELVERIPFPPEIISDLLAGDVPVVRMRWADVPLHDNGVFVGEGATLDLEVESSPERTVTTCTLEGFGIALPSEDKELLRVTFESITFTQQAGQSPDLDIPGLELDFRGALKLLQTLQEAVGLSDLGPWIDASPTGVVARYSLPVPEVSSGAFVMRNIVFTAGVDVPFNGDPVTLSLAFASREEPFSLTVNMLGGGGYVVLEIDHTGVKSIEAALEFGALVAIDFIVASAEIYAFGGIRYAMTASKVIELSAFIRIGGAVEILGLVTVSIDLRVELKYIPEENTLVGRAKLVVEIDLTLYSDSLELDSGEWRISGGLLDDADQPLGLASRLDQGIPDETRDAWLAYRKAFAS